MKLRLAFVVCLIFSFVANDTELNAQSALLRNFRYEAEYDSTGKQLGLVIRGSRAPFCRIVIDDCQDCEFPIPIIIEDNVTTVEPEKLSASSTSLTIYPNPTSDNINIEYPFRFIGKRKYLTIHSMIGELVLSKEFDTENQSESIDVRTLPTGMYIVR
jgi:hypothetical protein